ncbi:MAG: hypothetical protein ACRDS0_10795 [Pseudonocardiaceae bacterium]
MWRNPYYLRMALTKLTVGELFGAGGLEHRRAQRGLLLHANITARAGERIDANEELLPGGPGQVGEWW